MIVAYIDAYKLRFGVEQICRVLTEHGTTIFPSTYYSRSSSPTTEAELADAYAAHEVYCLFHAQRGLYGALKLWHSLRRWGHDIGRDQVARLMGICGVAGIVRGKRRTITTESDPGADRHPDLINREWNTPDRPDQWWVADFTYVWTLAGFCYVSFIVDVYSRRILGWRASMTRRSDLVLSALEQAIHTRRRGSFEFTSTGLVHHSDAGTQYTSDECVTYCANNGFTQSMGRTGVCWDNADAETFFATLKNEMYHQQVFTTRARARFAVAEYIEVFYNRRRPHSSIGYRTPARAWKDHHAAQGLPRAA